MKKSLQDVIALSRIIHDIPLQFAEEAIFMVCACLDGPTFNPQQPLPSSQDERVKLALFALINITNIHEMVLRSARASGRLEVVPTRSWPSIWRWLQYFFYNDNAFVSAKSPEDKSFTNSLELVSAVLAQIDSEQVTKAMTDDGLFEMVVKVWLKTKDDADHRKSSIPPRHESSHRTNNIVDQLFHGLAVLKKGDRAKEAHAIILREAAVSKVPLDVISKRLMGLVRNPEKADRSKSRKRINIGLMIIHCLAANDETKGISGPFMDEFLKDDIVALTVHLFTFVCCEDMVRPRKYERLPDHFPDDMYEGLILYCIQILWYSSRSQNGAHWACVMLNHGLLRVIACVASNPQLGERFKLDLSEIVRDIALHFCHVSVVTAAIKAVNEIMVDGTIEKLRSSGFKEVWTNFEDTLLERTIYKAMYDRRCVSDLNALKCANVHVRLSSF